MAGKGSRPRPVDMGKWCINYDNIKFPCAVSEEIASAWLCGPVLEKIGMTMANTNGVVCVQFGGEPQIQKKITYQVEIDRTEVRSACVVVQADSAIEAEDIAIDLVKSPNYRGFSTGDVEYEIYNIERLCDDDTPI